MKFLLDTQLILWLYAYPDLVPPVARHLVSDLGNTIYYIPASMLGIEIKNAKQRADFEVDCRQLHLALQSTGVLEFPVSTAHAIAISRLPRLHKNPFDRLLLAQAMTEDLTLLTTDHILGQYPSNVLNVR